jgi:hypothetical protein
MQGNLADVIGTDKDISEYNSTKVIPDFHKNIAPLFTKSGLNGGKSCVDCHNAKDKLNLANMTGVSLKTSMYRTFVLGAHKVKDKDKILPNQYADINPLGMDSKYHPAPFLWSLILDDDLSVPSDDNHSNTAARNLERKNDFGAQYDEDVISELNRINGDYNHSKHWSLEDTQKMITYGSTRLAVGLSDKIDFTENSLSISTPQAQKAYQALVKNCYECHNTHTAGGLQDANFTDIIPKEKRFTSASYLRDSRMR